MPPDRERLRFYVDESALGVGKALTAARRDVVHVGHAVVPDLPLGVLDIDWIPRVAELGLIVILRDKRIRTKPAELELFRQHGLRAFWIAGKKDTSTWDQLCRLVRRWGEMERIIATLPDGPWFMAIDQKAIKAIKV